MSKSAMLSLVHRGRVAVVSTYCGSVFLLYTLPFLDPTASLRAASQPSGNVWVTHEEMETLAAPAKTVSPYGSAEHEEKLLCCYLDDKAVLFTIG